MRKILERIVHIIDRIESHLAVYLLGAIVMIMTLEVVMRYVFENPLSWTQELSILMLIYLSFFAADLAYRRKAHIGIDFFVGLFRDRLKKISELFVRLLLLVFFFVVFLASLTAIRLQAGHEFAGVLPLSKVFWILPVSLVFPSMFVTTVLFVVQLISARSEPHSRYDKIG